VIFDARELAQLRVLEILAGKIVKGQLTGDREMSHSGPGSGFRGHRAYAPGDAIRLVDWHVYARMDALVVKEFEAEEALDLLLVQDRSASMRGRAATCAAKVAAGLGAAALSHLDRVVWIPVGDRKGARVFSGRARLPDLLEQAEPRAEGGTDLRGALLAQLPRSSRGGVAFVVSDFFDPRGATRALSYLLERRYRVRAILVEDAQALAPPPLGRARLVDAESGAVRTLEITPEAVALYRSAREQRVLSLRTFCHRSGIGFLRARADQPFFEIVRAAVARGWLTR
jgi:uncharacterized protein (DUF58 family)